MGTANATRWIFAAVAVLSLSASAAAFPFWPLGWPIIPGPYSTTPPVPSDGVQITWVRPTSPAASAGLEPGDIILKVNGFRVHSIEDVQLELQISAWQRTPITVLDHETKRIEVDYVYPGHGGWIGATGRRLPSYPDRLPKVSR